jgi:hypothetical protein
MVAHQCTVDSLQALKDEEHQESQEEDVEQHSLPFDTGSVSVKRAMGVRHRPSRSLDSQIVPLPSSPEDFRQKRASVWLIDLIFDSSPLPAGLRRQTWGHK